jgi:hypothetical protein
VDISRAITYAFDDPAWQRKLGLGALVSLVPILNFASLGFGIDVLRNAEAGRPLPLPDWDDLETKFVTGAKLGLALFIYGLPSFLFILVPISLVVVPALAHNDNTRAVLATVGGLAALALGCLWMLYLLVFSFITPAIQIHFAHVGTFAACFQLRAIVALIRTHSSQYLTAWAATLLVGLGYVAVIGLFNGIVSWIPCLGLLLVLLVIPVSAAGGVWLATVHGYLFGQVGREAG